MAQLHNDSTIRHTRRAISIPANTVSVSGLESVGAFLVSGELFLKPGDPLTEFLGATARAAASGWERAMYAYLSVLGGLGETLVEPGIATAGWLIRYFESNELALLRSDVDLASFSEALRNSNRKTFDPFAWNRRANQTESFMGDFYVR